MNAAQTIDTQLRRLEEQLLQPAVRSSPERVAALLADDFLEFGSSGRIINKKQVIEALEKEVPIERSLSDFCSRMLSDKIVLVTYRATSLATPGAPPAHTLRSSIWRLTGDQWQMMFHQGTSTTVEDAR